VAVMTEARLPDPVLRGMAKELIYKTSSTTVDVMVNATGREVASRGDDSGDGYQESSFDDPKLGRLDFDSVFSPMQLFGIPSYTSEHTTVTTKFAAPFKDVITERYEHGTSAHPQLHVLFAKLGAYQPTCRISAAAARPTTETRSCFYHELRHDSEGESWRLTVYFAWLPKETSNSAETSESSDSPDYYHHEFVWHKRVRETRQEMWYNQFTAKTTIVVSQCVAQGAHRVSSRVFREFAPGGTPRGENDHNNRWFYRTPRGENGHNNRWHRLKDGGQTCTVTYYYGVHTPLLIFNESWTTEASVAVKSLTTHSFRQPYLDRVPAAALILDECYWQMVDEVRYPTDETNRSAVKQQLDRNTAFIVPAPVHTLSANVPDATCSKSTIPIKIDVDHSTEGDVKRGVHSSLPPSSYPCSSAPDASSSSSSSHTNARPSAHHRSFDEALCRIVPALEIGDVDMRLEHKTAIVPDVIIIAASTAKKTLPHNPRDDEKEDVEKNSPFTFVYSVPIDFRRDTTYSFVRECRVRRSRAWTSDYGKRRGERKIRLQTGHNYTCPMCHTWILEHDNGTDTPLTLDLVQDMHREHERHPPSLVIHAAFRDVCVYTRRPWRQLRREQWYSENGIQRFAKTTITVQVPTSSAKPTRGRQESVSTINVGVNGSDAKRGGGGGCGCDGGNGGPDHASPSNSIPSVVGVVVGVAVTDVNTEVIERKFTSDSKRQHASASQAAPSLSAHTTGVAATTTTKKKSGGRTKRLERAVVVLDTCRRTDNATHYSGRKALRDFDGRVVFCGVVNASHGVLHAPNIYRTNEKKLQKSDTKGDSANRVKGDSANRVKGDSANRVKGDSANRDCKGDTKTNNANVGAETSKERVSVDDAAMKLEDMVMLPCDDDEFFSWHNRDHVTAFVCSDADPIAEIITLPAMLRDATHPLPSTLLPRSADMSWLRMRQEAPTSLHLFTEEQDTKTEQTEQKERESLSALLKQQPTPSVVDTKTRSERYERHVWRRNRQEMTRPMHYRMHARTSPLGSSSGSRIYFSLTGAIPPAGPVYVLPTTGDPTTSHTYHQLVRAYVDAIAIVTPRKSHAGHAFTARRIVYGKILEQTVADRSADVDQQTSCITYNDVKLTVYNEPHGEYRSCSIEVHNLAAPNGKINPSESKIKHSVLSTSDNDTLHSSSASARSSSSSSTTSTFNTTYSFSSTFSPTTLALTSAPVSSETTPRPHASPHALSTDRKDVSSDNMLDGRATEENVIGDMIFGKSVLFRDATPDDGMARRLKWYRRANDETLQRVSATLPVRATVVDGVQRIHRQIEQRALVDVEASEACQWALEIAKAAYQHPTEFLGDAPPGTWLNVLEDKWSVLCAEARALIPGLDSDLYRPPGTVVYFREAFHKLEVHVAHLERLGRQTVDVKAAMLRIGVQHLVHNTHLKCSSGCLRRASCLWCVIPVDDCQLISVTLPPKSVSAVNSTRLGGVTTPVPVTTTTTTDHKRESSDQNHNDDGTATGVGLVSLCLLEPIVSTDNGQGSARSEKKRSSDTDTDTDNATNCVTTRPKKKKLLGKKTSDEEEKDKCERVTRNLVKALTVDVRHAETRLRAVGFTTVSWMLPETEKWMKKHKCTDVAHAVSRILQWAAETCHDALGGDDPERNVATFTEEMRQPFTLQAPEDMWSIEFQTPEVSAFPAWFERVSSFFGASRSSGNKEKTAKEFSLRRQDESGRDREGSDSNDGPTPSVGSVTKSSQLKSVTGRRIYHKLVMGSNGMECAVELEFIPDADDLTSEEKKRLPKSLPIVETKRGGSGALASFRNNVEREEKKTVPAKRLPRISVAVGANHKRRIQEGMTLSVVPILMQDDRLFYVHEYNKRRCTMCETKRCDVVQHCVCRMRACSDCSRKLMARETRCTRCRNLVPHVTTLSWDVIRQYRREAAQRHRIFTVTPIAIATPISSLSSSSSSLPLPRLPVPQPRSGDSKTNGHESKEPRHLSPASDSKSGQTFEPHTDGKSEVKSEGKEEQKPLVSPQPSPVPLSSPSSPSSSSSASSSSSTHLLPSIAVVSVPEGEEPWEDDILFDGLGHMEEKRRYTLPWGVSCIDRDRYKHYVPNRHVEEPIRTFDSGPKRHSHGLHVVPNFDDLKQFWEFTISGIPEALRVPFSRPPPPPDDMDPPPPPPSRSPPPEPSAPPLLAITGTDNRMPTFAVMPLPTAPPVPPLSASSSSSIYHSSPSLPVVSATPVFAGPPGGPQFDMEVDFDPPSRQFNVADDLDLRVHSVPPVSVSSFAHVSSCLTSCGPSYSSRSPVSATVNTSTTSPLSPPPPSPVIYALQKIPVSHASTSSSAPPQSRSTPILFGPTRIVSSISQTMSLSSSPPSALPPSVASITPLLSTPTSLSPSSTEALSSVSSAPSTSSRTPLLTKIVLS
jgi:hypothetical protein